MARNALNAIKKINYQYSKRYTDNRGVEKKVEDAVSIINGQLQDPVPDSEMPDTIMDVSVDWTAGSPNDTVYVASLGNYIGQQDVSIKPANIRLKQPLNITATNNELQKSINITWDEMVSASGYKIYRDGKLAGNVIFDGANGDFSISGGTVSYTDNVGDKNQHTYYIIAKEADSEDSSEYSDGNVGKGWDWVTNNVSISNGGSRTVTVSADAFDANITVSSVAGSIGESGGLGGKGLNLTPLNLNANDSVYFKSSSVNVGLFNGGDLYTGYPYPYYKGGGSSGIRINGVALAGAGGGASRALEVNNKDVEGGGGGGVLGAGGNAVSHVGSGTESDYYTLGAAGAGGGGGGTYANKNGSAYINSGTFGGLSWGSTTTNATASGSITAVIKWKE